MKVSTLMNKLEDYGVDREVVAEVPEWLSTVGIPIHIASVRRDGEYVVLDLGDPVEPVGREEKADA